MIRFVFILSTFLFLNGCGGSSAVNNPPAPPVLPPTPPPSSNIPDPIFPADTSRTTCAGLDYIELLSVESDSTVDAGFEASKAIDGSLLPNNRWQSSASDAQLTVELGYRHLIKEIGTAWFEGDQSTNSFDISVSEDGLTYTTLLSNETSSGTSHAIERFDVPDTVARFVRIISNGNMSNTTALSEIAVFGCPLDVSSAPLKPQTVDLAQYNLSPNAPSGDNFDLLTWALDTPRTDPSDGFSLRASERQLDAGFTDDEYFFTADDGGMTFRATIFGAKTSANTSFTRSELREMLRRGNTGISTQGVNLNNWILGYQPDPGRSVGGRGGVLQATLKVDKVTTTGSQSHTGRVIIGQIHAGDDEPIRLYYKKFPNNERGYIYFAHELNGGEDLWKTVLGPVNNNQNNQPIFTSNPAQGIALGEVFSYEIIQEGARIDVIIRRGDLNAPIIAHQYVDMIAENSGYDVVDNWNYFKAGAYSQNNTGEDGDANGVGSDYDQVTFYYLKNSH
ncbi:polysaccharide lyase family 7 protein [Glaciecola sp. SC05]|uniref:polysaccharide lyase family 7 protein n=1 Tax=Glaciecola sp. SC05 TaxID=1987355 RepID=UPI003527DB38